MIVCIIHKPHHADRAGSNIQIQVGVTVQQLVAQAGLIGNEEEMGDDL